MKAYQKILGAALLAAASATAVFAQMQPSTLSVNAMSPLSAVTALYKQVPAAQKAGFARQILLNTANKKLMNGKLSNDLGVMMIVQSEGIIYRSMAIMDYMTAQKNSNSQVQSVAKKAIDNQTKRVNAIQNILKSQSKGIAAEPNSSAVSKLLANFKTKAQNGEIPQNMKDKLAQLKSHPLAAYMLRQVIATQAALNMADGYLSFSYNKDLTTIATITKKVAAANIKKVQDWLNKNSQKG